MLKQQQPMNINSHSTLLPTLCKKKASHRMGSMWCAMNVGECAQGDCYLTLRRLMSYIYGAPILDVSRSHTTTQHSR